MLRTSALFPCLFHWLAVLPLSLAQPAAAGSIDDCRYADGVAARAAWVPMGRSAAADVAVLGGRNVLRLACNFAGTQIERASWDRAVNLDLASGSGIQFKILCRDASPVSYFTVYFQSGDGWYDATFFPESSSDWNTITINKAQTTIEGKPAGWGQIRTIRISAWRAKAVNTEFCLSDLRQVGVLGDDAAVAILRAESVGRRLPEETRSVNQYTEEMVERFQALDIGCTVISDLDSNIDRLKRAKLVVLPHNPAMPDPVADQLLDYLKGGGRLLAFYTVPDRLRAAMGIKEVKYISPPNPGAFSAIRFGEGSLPGAPETVQQASWNINAMQLAPGVGRPVGEWVDKAGRPTGYPAMVGTSNWLVMSHVLLSDDAPNKSRLLLAMAGSLVPELWRQAAEKDIARIGTIAGFKTFDQAVEQIARLNPGNERVSNALAVAASARQLAASLSTQGRFPESLEQSAVAAQRVQEAFCRAQSPLPGEFRAFWCHSAFGVQGLEWDEAIHRLAQNGFSAILPNMLWGGAAYYPSGVLPQAEGGDQVARCLAACRKYGVQMHVWKVNWNLGSSAPADFVERMRREGRLQANAQGREQPWLCPSHPENRKLELDSLVEVVRKYEVDGIHFDYIRYPDGDHCFCAGCKARFERVAGAPIRNWPREVLAEGSLRQRWLDWRRDNISAVVKAVSEQARAVRPRIKLSAAVFSNWPVDRDGVGQDWKLWCEKGWLDFVCPMDYTPSNRRFENLVADQVQWAGRVPCYPGIGVSASTSHFGVDRVIEQIEITRRHQTGGFTIFNYGATESGDLLPWLGMGITATR